MRRVQRRGPRSNPDRRRAARSMKPASNCALCAVNTAPSSRSVNSSSAVDIRGASRSIGRVMPWISVGPTRWSGQRSLTSVLQRSISRPSLSTMTAPICKIRSRRWERPDVSTSTTAKRGSGTTTTLDSLTHRVGVRRRFDAVCEESDVSGSAGVLGEAAAHADRCGHGKSSEVPFFFGLARPEAVLVVLASELLARFAHLAL